MAANNRYGISDSSGSIEVKTVNVSIPQSGWVNKTYTLTNASALGFPTVDTQLSISPQNETRENIKTYVEYEIFAEHDISNNQMIFTCTTVPITTLDLKFQWTTITGAGDSENIELSDSLPIINGTANPGTSDQASRADHIHPVDTSRAAFSHATTTTTHGAGNATNYGHLKLSDGVTGTETVNGGTAATPNAVRLAYQAAGNAAEDADTAINIAQAAQSQAGAAQSAANAAQATADAAVKTVNNVAPNTAGNVTIVIPTFTVQDYKAEPTFTNTTSGETIGSFTVRYRVLSQNGIPIAVIPHNLSTSLVAGGYIESGAKFNIPGTHLSTSARAIQATYTCPTTLLVGGLIDLNPICKFSGFLELKDRLYAPAEGVFIPHIPQNGLASLHFDIGARNDNPGTIVGTSDSYEMSFQGIIY